MFISAIKRFQTVYQESAFKSQQPKTAYLIARECRRKPTELIKLLCVKCSSVTGTAKGIVMTHNNIFC